MQVRRHVAGVAILGLLAPTLVAVDAVAAGAAGKNDHVTLHALAVSEGPNGSTGSSNEFAIDYEKGSGDTFRVGISEDEVEGTGDQWRAAGWNAAAVATILTGAPLSGVRVNYDVNGRIDGPSAGALMTVGLLSLIRGDKIKPGITMTGTINPDGTVGPVGGIPYKVDGANKAKAKTMLIPLGQRNSADDSGDLVDVVDLGERKGVKVKEVGDIYAAYKAFTGKTLPRPKQAGDVSLSNDDYKQIKARVKGQLADFQSAAGEFNSLAPAVQNELTSITSQANDAKQRAQDLSDNGSQAGAYSEALSAAALANAAVRVGQLYQVLLTQGVGPFVEQVKSSEAVEGKVEALFDELKATKTKTVSDASNAVNAYSNAIDALSAASYGDNLLQDAKTVGELEPALTKAILGAVFYEIAGSQVEGTKDILEVGKGQGGTKIDKSVDVEAVADFYRKAADANLSAFNALIIEPEAQKAGLDAAAAQSAFANADFDYALAQSSLGVLNGGLDDYLGNSKTAAYAKLGGAVSLYTRTAGLLSKYYSLGQLNDDLEVVGITNERAMTNALDLGRDQVERGVGVLKAKKVSPTLVVGSYEIAGVDREGEASDKLDALDEYLAAFVGSRVLAYLGGFEQTGLK
jgi:predicted S18 family serine protease